MASNTLSAARPVRIALAAGVAGLALLASPVLAPGQAQANTPLLQGQTSLADLVEKVMPAGLLSPAATLTTALTSGFSNATTGSIQYHALWALGLLLMAMSLVFILIIHLIGRKGAKARG